MMAAQRPMAHGAITQFGRYSSSLQLATSQQLIKANSSMHSLWKPITKHSQH